MTKKPLSYQQNRKLSSSESFATQKAGRYALSLTSLFDAHLVAISVVVEPYLARNAYPKLRYVRIAATREEMQQEARNIVDKIKTERNASK